MVTDDPCLPIFHRVRGTRLIQESKDALPWFGVGETFEFIPLRELKLCNANLGLNSCYRKTARQKQKKTKLTSRDLERKSSIGLREAAYSGHSRIPLGLLVPFIPQCYFHPFPASKIVTHLNVMASHFTDSTPPTAAVHSSPLTPSPRTAAGSPPSSPPRLWPSPNTLASHVFLTFNSDTVSYFTSVIQSRDPPLTFSPALESEASHVLSITFQPSSSSILLLTTGVQSHRQPESLGPTTLHCPLHIFSFLMCQPKCHRPGHVPSTPVPLCNSPGRTPNMGKPSYLLDMGSLLFSPFPLLPRPLVSLLLSSLFHALDQLSLPTRNAFKNSHLSPKSTQCFGRRPKYCSYFFVDSFERESDWPSDLGNM